MVVPVEVIGGSKLYTIHYTFEEMKQMSIISTLNPIEPIYTSFNIMMRPFPAALPHDSYLLISS